MNIPPLPAIPEFQAPTRLEYLVVHAVSLKVLNQAVNQMISEGWRPQGGLAPTYVGNWAQAMVRDIPK